MAKLTFLAVLLALAASANAQCGNGANAQVTGSSGNYRAVNGGRQVYAGGDYRAAIQAAVNSISSGQKISVMASGNIGANSITIQSGKTFEGCGTIECADRRGRGCIEAMNTQNVNIPQLTLTGSASFGMLFYGTRGLKLGRINLNLRQGMGIRFHRDEAANSDVTMDTISCNGPTSHCVETWNINGLNIGSVIARNVGECGLLLQKVTNVRVGLVDGDNVARGNGYATLRFANEAGRQNNYATNIVVENVKSRGGGRGIFCVSQSGGVQINNIDLANNGNNAILIENCYNFNIRGGTVNGGGEVRLAARTEFANSRDISLNIRVDGTSVRESPCAQNSRLTITGNASKNIC